MEKYTVDPNCQETQIVGEIPAVVIKHFKLVCPLPPVVKMFPGAIKHIKKKHAAIFAAHHQSIPDIITNPDYVGQNPTEPNSVEMYKYFGDTLLVAIKLDPTGYFYLSSFYDLNNAQNKIPKRLKAGRIVVFSDLS